MMAELRPAATAFDADRAIIRRPLWVSGICVAAQRRAVRAELLRVFPKGGRILELGGGTGVDATFLAERGFEVLLTDPSLTMVKLAKKKLVRLGSEAMIAAGEDMDKFAANHLADGGAQFDGVFSNFAPLNCVADLGPVARGLARLTKPGALAMLVLFGTFCPAEMIGRSAARLGSHLALRRCKRGAAPARLATHEFEVIYLFRRAERLIRCFCSTVLRSKGGSALG